MMKPIKSTRNINKLQNTSIQFHDATVSFTSYIGYTPLGPTCSSTEIGGREDNLRFRLAPIGSECSDLEGYNLGSIGKIFAVSLYKIATDQLSVCHLPMDNWPRLQFLFLQQLLRHISLFKSFLFLSHYICRFTSAYQASIVHCALMHTRTSSRKMHDIACIQAAE